MNPRPDSPRRLSVELRFDGAAPSLPSVGGRALHQYWSLLAPHFRPVFLPPLWRSGGDGLSWSWREPASRPPPSAAELASLRKRLTGAQRSLADATRDAAPTPATHTLVSLSQLQTTTADIADALLALPDTALAAYVARTDTGLMLHSWGLPSALTPFQPDATDKEIAGTVFTSRHPAPGLEVLLETDAGQPINRTYSDATGRFSFSKISAGHYRVRATSPLVPFPAEGTAVHLLNTSVTDIALHDHAGPRSGTAAAHRRRRLVAVFLLVFAVLLLALAALAWRSHRDTALFSSHASASTPPAAAYIPRSLSENAAGAPPPSFPTFTAPNRPRPVTAAPATVFPDGSASANSPTLAASSGHAGQPPPPPAQRPAQGTAKTRSTPPSSTPKPLPSPLTSSTSASRPDAATATPAHTSELQNASTSPSSPPSRPSSLPNAVTGIPEENPAPHSDALAAAPQSPEATAPRSVSSTAKTSTNAVVESPAPAFVQRQRFHLSPWQPRLVRDAILPTQPTPVRQRESVDTLRARVFQEHQARLPAGFQPPAITTGFALDLPAEVAAQWKFPGNTDVPNATVRGTHAEITLPLILPRSTSPAIATLVTDIRELARLTLDSDGTATLTLAPGVHAWPWIALNPSGSAATPLSPQILHGPPAPATWRTLSPPHDSLSPRLALIASPTDTGLHRRTLALIDGPTGWALTSELTTVNEAP